MLFFCRDLDKEVLFELPRKRNSAEERCKFWLWINPNQELLLRCYKELCTSEGGIISVNKERVCTIVILGVKIFAH